CFSTRDEDDTLLFRIQISERIFACIISQPREGNYRNGAKVAFRHLHSGLKRIIHENSRTDQDGTWSHHLMLIVVTMCLAPDPIVMG
ncbi:unnamed protein product, partial [Urochloa humidicola]